MRNLVLAGVTLATILATGQAAARQTAPSDDALIAEFLVSALPRSDYSWAREWRAVRINLRHARWHMVTPQEADEDRAAGDVRQRVGWIDGAMFGMGFTACGDIETVRAVSMSTRHPAMAYDDRRPPADLSPGLRAALKAAGAEVREVSRSGRDIDYLLTAPQRDPGVLHTSVRCRSPKSRAGPNCVSHHTLVLRPDYRTGGSGGHASEACTRPDL